MKRILKIPICIFMLLSFFILLTSCNNSNSEIPVVKAVDINFELAAELPTPGTPWSRKTPDANGDYCCVLPNLKWSNFNSIGRCWTCI